MKHKIWIGVGIVVVVLLLGGLLAFLWYTDRNLNYFERSMKTVYLAGYRDKTATINGGSIAYIEGPDNGPPLLLVHGQMVDKYNYAPLLPGLSRSFHVFAVDCYGHGGSSHLPEKYSNVAHGKDFLAFIEQIIGKPALVSGHSSGGLIAAWLAAYGGAWVEGVLFEDPPFFTLSLPEARNTWNWVDLATTAHQYLKSNESDWTRYSTEHARIWDFFGNAKKDALAEARRYHAQHPDEPIKWSWLPPIMNESFRAIPNYDPRFGEVFYQGKWEEGFDLEAALKAVTVAVIYQKSDATIDEEGILRGATSDVESARAMRLMPGAKFYTDQDNHAWHWLHPQQAVQRLLELKTMAGL